MFVEPAPSERSKPMPQEVEASKGAAVYGTIKAVAGVVAR